jgi:EAL domain-containing protein (putative c-di-GMP-specific phosphodiesterase class I)
MIQPLSRWVLDSALGQYAAWRKSGLVTTMAVNLSMRNVHDVEWPNTLAALLQDWAVPAGAIKLEITESAFMANPARAMQVVTDLRSMGVQISIDDFGTGFSSLSYLKQLSLDEIKIDRSFVTDMAVNSSDFAIVRATIDLGHSLGLKVVAEGVEDRATWDLLAMMGCDRAQGFYLSRPLPPADLVEWFDGRCTDRSPACGDDVWSPIVASPAAPHWATVTPIASALPVLAGVR